MRTIILSSLFLIISTFVYEEKAVANEGRTVRDDVITSEQPLKSEPKTAPIVRAGDIYASCQHHFENVFNTTENIAKRASCNGYFFGIGGILIILQSEKANTKTCIPEDISAHDLAKVFLEWTKNPKNDLNISAPEATIMALREKYKCD
ncbi:MAG: hypothetical protein COV35_11080 [Alphaproteobacteria bacterium CG11_big_fil_rev_8_21_14_0_20_39_49]|nr:MAG: hypothetical protein COV35_11080 [Alphaproteobacteria bacterium CG11_big_fil_rev_8_21_14_0_20_39_49]